MSRMWIPKFFEWLIEPTPEHLKEKRKKKIFKLKGKKYVIKDYVGRKPKSKKLAS